MAKTTEPQDHFIDILQHRIKFWLRGENAPTELDEASEEHIRHSIIEGFSEGSLHVMGGPDYETQFDGYWKIDR